MSERMHCAVAMSQQLQGHVNEIEGIVGEIQSGALDVTTSIDRLIAEQRQP
ncbi:hypothetical protein [Parahaliea mediterranea]|uniref:Uncharacterized protein n=1 Tax=Parahaliea mediterranea TaxID=651086 RepID=A0A939IL67_9GAMM|nr:hypothetical protein [Parahaliea mediterranea]MBN7795663.1 hypothetical protein [Parahaliea mediterranea]